MAEIGGFIARTLLPLLGENSHPWLARRLFELDYDYMYIRQARTLLDSSGMPW